MALFILSDTHLSLSVHKPMDIFGTRWKDHDEKIASIWKERVTNEDTVIIGGDISWGISLQEACEDLKLIDSLPGKKIFLRGNHDYWWNTLSKNQKFFEKNGISTIEFLQNNAISTQGFVICGTRGWYNDEDANPRECDYQKIVTREALRLKMSLECAKSMEGEKIVILHFPVVFGEYVCRELLDVLHQFDIKRCYFGHIHSLYKIPQTIVYEGISFTLTSADYLNFRPYKIEHGEKF